MDKVFNRKKEHAPFSASWHQERTLGSAPAEIATHADLSDPKGPLRIRVYGDDGTLAEAVLALG